MLDFIIIIIIIIIIISLQLTNRRSTRHLVLSQLSLGLVTKVSTRKAASLGPSKKSARLGTLRWPRHQVGVFLFHLFLSYLDIFEIYFN